MDAGFPPDACAYGRGAVYDVALLAWLGLRVRAVGIAQYAAANAYVLILYAPAAEHLPALSGIKHLPGAVNPAGAKAYAVCGVHKVAHDETAVRKTVAIGTVRKHYYYCRRRKRDLRQDRR